MHDVESQAPRLVLVDIALGVAVLHRHRIEQVHHFGWRKVTASIALHSVRGGVMNIIRGGDVGDGMLRAGLTEALSPLAGIAGDNVPVQYLFTAVIGGTVDEVTGGKLANGAGSAVFALACNHLSDKFLSETGFESLGDGYYGRMDLDPIGSGNTAVEVHVYKEGAGLEKAIKTQNKIEPRKYEKGIWGLDRETETFGWSKNLVIPCGLP